MKKSAGNEKTAKEIPAHIRDLIDKLGSKDGTVRQEARQTFVEMGTDAVDFLAELIDVPTDIIRWEAIKALGQIADPLVVPLLIDALEDDWDSVRWLAAEGLINIGNASVVPLLEQLRDRYDSVLLREGAHHVFKELSYQQHGLQEIVPLLALLDGSGVKSEIPFSVKDVLEKVRPKS